MATEDKTPEGDNQEILEHLDQRGQTEELVEMFEELPTHDVVEFLEEKPMEEITAHLAELELEDQGRIVSDFPPDLRLRLFRALDRRKMAAIFAKMFSDVRADLYQALEKEEQISFLPFLERKVREDVIILSAYPPETAGGIMNTDFATVFVDMVAEEAMAKVRKDAPSKDHITYIYVVDESMVMQGFVTLKDLVLAQPGDRVSEMMNDFFVHAEVGEDRESVAQKVEKYDLATLPVLNSLGQLVGVVDQADAIEVIRAEQSEDLEKIAGVMPSEDGEDYLQTSSVRHFRKRVIWLVSLAAVGIVSGMIINQYSSILDQFIILAMYMPMMAATGGNTGTQAAAVVIRGLSLGQISEEEWLRVVSKELRISFMLSLCVAALTYFKIVFLSFNNLLPESFTLEHVGLTISVAIAIQVITSAMMGAGLPLLVHRLKGDPAVVASPAITTLVDITGLLIYFSIASWMLGIA